MLYKYYKETMLDEHMLYASEIAEKFNIVDKNNIPSARVVAANIKQYISKNNLEVDKIFYSTKYGLQRVYPFHIYNEMVKEYKLNQEKRGI